MAQEGKSCGMHGFQDEHKQQDMEIKERLSHIRHKILVMSGKGGVGKSSVAAYLAVTLAKKGYKVGLMDVDLHGPSIPRLLGLKGSIQPGSKEGKAKPVRYIPNLDVISIEPLMGDNKDRATIWRGPLKIGVIRQFIADIEWEDLDYLIIDSPPGTGDEPLTVAQTIPDAKALIVTTPQEISLADVRKSINFCRTVNMQILGIVENMSGFKCPHCGEIIELFKAHGGMLTAKQEGLRFLGSLPLEAEVVQNGDVGSMEILEREDSAFKQAFFKMVDLVIEVCGRESTAKIAQASGGAEKKAAKKDGRLLVVPVSDGRLSPHFGHCEQFAFIEAEDGKIKKVEMKTPPQHEPGVIPRWLHEEGADVVIAGGIGDRAQQLLEEKGIDVIVGAPEKSPEALAEMYLSGALMSGENVCDH
mgnify:CR=1 FL=1